MRWCGLWARSGAKAPLWGSVCVFGGCNAVVGDQPVCSGQNPPHCVCSAKACNEQWADVRRLLPPACGYGADMRRPPEHAST